MARRSDHSRDEIREMALVAAETIIREQGYPALSARKLASAIGYTVGTLYLVFRNLDDLVLQVNGRSLDALYASLLMAMERCQDGAGCALALGRTYLRFATEHPHRWGAMFEHNLPPGEPVPEPHLEKVARIFALVEGVLRRLAPERSRSDIAIAARALWSGVHGVCILGLTDRLDLEEGGSLDELVESLITNYLDGFCRRC